MTTPASMAVHTLATFSVSLPCDPECSSPSNVTQEMHVRYLPLAAQAWAGFILQTSEHEPEIPALTLHLPLEAVRKMLLMAAMEGAPGRVAPGTFTWLLTEAYPPVPAADDDEFPFTWRERERLDDEEEA